MPMYEFQLVGGTETIERYYPAAQAPELGAKILAGGKAYMRIISVGPEVCVKSYGHVSYSLPRNCKDAPHYDAQGRPAFESKQEVMEFAKKSKMRWD